MGKERRDEATHRARPIRNFLYTVYSLINAVAFTVFFYTLYLAVRTPRDTAVMIACGAVVALGLFVGILKPTFSKRR